MIKRDLAQKLTSLATQFPAVALLGPRQSGKTTLAKTLFSHYQYFSFEDLDIRALATSDPRNFLERYKDAPGVIFDEVQHAPDLFSYMQTHIDTYKKPGHFIVTGSHNLLLNQSISQSLAGRIAILTLLPLSINELQHASLFDKNVDEVLLRGCYPALYAGSVLPVDWYKSYLNTYVERDVRQIQNVTNLLKFQTFMKLCAGRVGQILNMSSLASDADLSVHAVQEWLSVLEASYIIFLLTPYYRNFSKRVIKAPKLYFYDTGLACSLLSITNSEQVFLNPARSGLFESYVIADFYKQRFNKGLNPNCYYWRDQSGYEVDCVLEYSNSLVPIEIKASRTFNKHFIDYLSRWNTIAGGQPQDNILIYAGDINQDASYGRLMSWQSIGTLVQE